MIFFPTPRPKDGTLHFSGAPAFSAAVATHADFAGTYSTPASFDAAVRGSETAVRETLPAPRPQDGTLDFSIAPALPAAVATRDDSAGKRRADVNFNTAAKRDDTSIAPLVPATYLLQTHLMLVPRTNRDDRISIAPPSGVNARSSSARSASRMARHALITADKLLY